MKKMIFSVLVLLCFFVINAQAQQDTVEAEKSQKTLQKKGPGDKVITIKAIGSIEKFEAEVKKELLADNFLNESNQTVKLMFQYSDVLNGKSVLGDKYEKYKAILTKYFPVYDSYAGTKFFKFKKE